MVLRRTGLIENIGMQQSFLVQRFHPNLRIGLVPSVLRGKRLVPIHCQQGKFDSACGAHCAAIVLALLGEIHDTSVLSERRNGVAARLWKAAQATYFEGMNVKQLAEMLHDTGMEQSITTCTGRHSKCLKFVLERLDAGEVVIGSWLSRNGKYHHWVVIVGIEGIEEDGNFKPTTLLVLDPGLDEPFLSGYNGRLELNQRPVPRRSSYILYQCSDGSKLAVTLTSAIALGNQP